MAEMEVNQILAALDKALVQPFIEVVPWLIAAGIILIVFWLVSKLVKRIVVQILQSVGLDKWIEEHKITPAIGNKKVSEIVGSLAKWYFIWVGLFVVADYIKLQGLREFLAALVFYVPKVLVGILFFVAALLFAKYIANQILALKHRLKNVAAFLVQAIIVLFAMVLTLQMVLGTEVGSTIVDLLNIFVTPFVWALALVLGIVGGFAVGLAFKEEIKTFAKEMKREYLK